LVNGERPALSISTSSIQASVTFDKLKSGARRRVIRSKRHHQSGDLSGLRSRQAWPTGKGLAQLIVKKLGRVSTHFGFCE